MTMRKINRIRKSWQEDALFNKLSKNDQNLIREIRNRKLTYLSRRKFIGLLKCSEEITNAKIEGWFVEAGCALGGSAIFLSHKKNTSRPFYIYDVFEMIPSPSNNDTHEVHERYREISSGKSKGIDGDDYYGYKKNLYEEVINNLNQFDIDIEKNQIHLVKGLLQDTMVIEEPIALAHIDVDWYDPVKTALERLFPSLSVGGFIILDDYLDWGSCRRATDEFLTTIAGQYSLNDQYGSLIIKKIK